MAFSFWLAWNVTTRRAVIGISSPVFGLRPGRNPKTGEEIPITARRVVTFHASQKLKALVEQAHGGKQQQIGEG